MKKKEHAPGEGDSFLARMGAASGAPGRLAPLAPPPGQPAVSLPPPPAASSSAATAAAPQQQQHSAADDLLGLSVPAPAAAPANPAPAAEEGWATFD